MRSQLSEEHQISVHVLFASLNFITSPHLAFATSRTTARGIRDTALVGDMRRIVSATPASWCCVATCVRSQRMEALKDAMNMRNVPSDAEAAAAVAAAAAVVLFCKPANESTRASPPATTEAAVSLALPAPAAAAVPVAVATMSSFQRAMRAPTTTPSTATASLALRGTRRHAKDTRKVQKMAEDLVVVGKAWWSWGRRCDVYGVKALV